MLRALALAALLAPLTAAQTVHVPLKPHLPDAEGGAYQRASYAAEGTADLRWRDRPDGLRLVIDGDSARIGDRAGALADAGRSRLARIPVDGLGTVEVRAFDSAVLFRLADVRRGTARVGGAEAAVVLRRDAFSSAFDARADLLVDRDGDGAFRLAAELDSTGALRPRERVDAGEPVRIGGVAVAVDSVAADGSGLWLRSVGAAVAPEPGFTAPDAAFAALDGTAAPALADLRGKTAVVVVWSTTCPYCEEARPATNEAAASYADDPDVVWLAPAGHANVALDERADVVEAFLAERPYTADVVLAPAEALAALAVDAYPRYVVVAPDGEVVFDEVGTHPDRMAQLRAAIESTR